MASKKSAAEKAAPDSKDVEVQDVAKNRGGRTAYQMPPKHHTVLARSGQRLRNARKAVQDADEALYGKVLAALMDGVKPSAITRSTGENHTAIQRMVRRAKDEGHSF